MRTLQSRYGLTLEHLRGAAGRGVDKWAERIGAINTSETGNYSAIHVEKHLLFKNADKMSDSLWLIYRASLCHDKLRRDSAGKYNFDYVVRHVNAL